MILPILQWPHPSLKTVAVPFDWQNPEHRSGLLDLIETLKDSERARGLAATQLGLNFRAFAIKFNHKGLTACINPELGKASSVFETKLEECMSFPTSLKVKIARPVAGHVTYEVLENGPLQRVSATLQGFDYRCFCHEFDHLRGVTIEDYRRGRK